MLSGIAWNTHKLKTCTSNRVGLPRQTEIQRWTFSDSKMAAGDMTVGSTPFSRSTAQKSSPPRLLYPGGVAGVSRRGGVAELRRSWSRHQRRLGARAWVVHQQAYAGRSCGLGAHASSCRAPGLGAGYLQAHAGRQCCCPALPSLCYPPRPFPIESVVARSEAFRAPSRTSPVSLGC